MKIRPFLRFLAVLTLLAGLAFPAQSVEPEKDYTHLVNLLQELQQSYSAVLESDSLQMNGSHRREQLSELVKAADEITINLYSRKSDFAFDQAFALEYMSNIQASFEEQARLSNRDMVESRAGLRRYTMLEETLRDMYRNHPIDSLVPADSLLGPASVMPLEEMDPEKRAILDSCLNYTHALADFYRESVGLALQDSVYIAETVRRIQQAYDYVQASYADSQKNRFIGGNVNAIQIVRNWDTIKQEIKEDLVKRYMADRLTDDSVEDELNAHAWRGDFILGYGMLALVVLAFAFLIAGLISHFLFKRSSKPKIREFSPILSSILAVLLFALGMLLIRADRDNPYWRMAYLLLSQFSWLTLAIFVSLLIRIRGDQAKASRNIYIPTLLLAFLCILMRAIFLPVSPVPVIFPPILLVFIIWQTSSNIRYRTQVSGADRRYMWVSVGVMGTVFILSLVGYSMIGVLIMTFWTFLLALLHTITTLYYLMVRYYEDKVLRRKARYHQENPLLPLDDKDAFIEVTWLYDLLRMVAVPVLTLMAFPLSIILTGRAYQLTQAGMSLLEKPLFQRAEETMAATADVAQKVAQGVLDFLTIHNIVLVAALFFIFRYLIYLVKALYRVFKLRRIIEKKKDTQVDPLKESDVNLSLTNTLISLGGWFLFLITAFSILHIPTSAITAISTGLAAGIGFALKDLINNFFYGIQLMAGRIRVGDKISCDGVRGVVKRVSYQTTQVEDEDGSVIAFTNTDLFTKQFRNLNSGKNYELIKMPVSVSYGTDVEKARQVILDALKPIMTKDKYGRDIVDPSFPVDVRFDGFGDSSVNLIVALYTTVETHYTFPSRALEAIYNAFHENGIEIPFPQRDVYIKKMPAGKE
jgi:small-conductance mechanosensitive channel